MRFAAQTTVWKMPVIVIHQVGQTIPDFKNQHLRKTHRGPFFENALLRDSDAGMLALQAGI